MQVLQPSLSCQSLDLPVYGIAVGIKAIHEANLIHRDLKPDNIMLDKEKHPRIADMGIAREPALDLTTTGTPLYQAPEILRGDPTYTQAVDIYAYGLICYQVITGKPITLHGRPPRSPFAWNRAVLDDIRPEIPARTSKAARDLITNCWCSVPEKRYRAHEACEYIAEHASELLTGVNLDIFRRYCESINDAAQR